MVAKPGACGLREDLFNRLRSFHNRCVRSMCRITMAHTMKHRIASKSLFERLGVGSFDSYYNRRLLRWAGHVARMPMNRMPRKLLTGWVGHARPVGCPKMTWGRALNKAVTTFRQFSDSGAHLPQVIGLGCSDFDARQMGRAFRRPHIMPRSLLYKKYSSDAFRWGK